MLTSGARAAIGNISPVRHRPGPTRKGIVSPLSLIRLPTPCIWWRRPLLNRQSRPTIFHHTPSTSPPQRAAGSPFLSPLIPVSNKGPVQHRLQQQTPEKTVRRLLFVQTVLYLGSSARKPPATDGAPAGSFYDFAPNLSVALAVVTASPELLRIGFHLAVWRGSPRADASLRNIFV